MARHAAFTVKNLQQQGHVSGGIVIAGMSLRDAGCGMPSKNRQRLKACGASLYEMKAKISGCFAIIRLYLFFAVIISKLVLM